MTVEIENLEMRLNDTTIDDGSTGNIVSWLTGRHVLLCESKANIVALVDHNQRQLDASATNILEGGSNAGNLLFDHLIEGTIADTVTIEDDRFGVVAIVLKFVLFHQFDNHFPQTGHHFFALLSLHTNATIVAAKERIIRANCNSNRRDDKFRFTRVANVNANNHGFGRIKGKTLERIRIEGTVETFNFTVHLQEKGVKVSCNCNGKE